MTSGSDLTITILSDLHLAAGRDSGSGKTEPMERFFHDDAFARLINRLRERAMRAEHAHRLLVLGDLFDFPRTPVSVVSASAELNNPTTAAIAKLDRIADGHPAVFAALGRWLADGLPIDIVPGNHDIELMSVPVQHHLIRLLARAVGITTTGLSITVHPWIYHVPGLLYAEHGHQYHDINSFPALIRAVSARPDGVARPLGTALDAFALSVTARLGPAVDDPDSVLRLMRNVIRSGPRNALRVMPDAVRFALTAGRQVAGLASPHRKRRRQVYRTSVMPGQADLTGLPEEILVSIDRLAERSAKRLAPRMAGLAIQPLHRVWSHREGVDAPQRCPSYLERVVEDIHRLLEEEGWAAPFYVFGHSHLAQQRPLSGNVAGSVYLNSGSWAGHSPAVESRLTFVEVVANPDSGEAAACLMRWNDADGAIEPVMEPARADSVPALAKKRSAKRVGQPWYS